MHDPIDISFVVPNAPQALLVPNAIQTLGVAQLAALAQRRGLTARITDAYLEQLSPDETAARVLAQRPRQALGFFVPDESTFEHAMRTLVRVRRSAPELPVVLGGPFASMASQTILSTFPNVDAIVRGESDEALFEWLEVADARERWASLDNLAFVSRGEVVHTPLRRLRPSLDDLPLPDRDQTMDALRARGGSLSLVASRGCYAPCTYCVVQAYWGMAKGSKWRGYGVARAVDEVEHLVRRYGDRSISFMDDNFFGPGAEGGRRVLEIGEELDRRGLDIEFSIFARADNVVDHEQALRRLVDTGLRQLFIGMEAGSPRTLEIYRKLNTRAQNLAALARIRELGISAFLGAVFLHPWATLAEVGENLEFWDRVLDENPNVNTVIFGTVDVLHGTPMQAQLEREGRLQGAVLTGRKAVYLDEGVDCLARAWELAKQRHLFPVYIDAARGLDRLQRRAIDAQICRVQVDLLRDVLARVRAGVRDLDELSEAVGSHRLLAGLRKPTPTGPQATPEEIEGCLNIACL